MRFIHYTLLLLLVGFAIGMAALVSDRVFERLPHLEDELAYLHQAKTYAGGHLVTDIPEPRRAYWQPFVVDHLESGNRFSKYTPGWPLLLMIGVWLQQPWLVNTLLAGINVGLVYALGRLLFNRRTGLIAAALTAFSPMALLLNSTLMGHTAALTGVTAFMLAYRQLEQAPHRLRWAVGAGAALGWVVIMRPLTAIGISLPFILWSGWQVIAPLVRRQPVTRAIWWQRNLRPYLVLAGVTVLISLAIPIYNSAATGNPTQNLYTLVWSYDRVGFGECCGRSGHTLEKGLRHVRFDLSLMAADLFGWQWEDVRNSGVYVSTWLTTGTPGTSITPALEDHLRNNSNTWPLTGISWLLLPFGLIAGIKRRWTWLLAGTVLGLIGIHIAYWIGSQRYSTRYYFETLTALALLSALPLDWLMHRINRWLVAIPLTALLIGTLYIYSTPRINALHGYNFMDRSVLEGVAARRSDDTPVLVIVSGEDVRWRALGELMAVTSPYLDSDIVMAWDNLQPGVRDAIIARFPERPIIEMTAAGNDAAFVDPPPNH